MVRRLVVGRTDQGALEELQDFEDTVETARQLVAARIQRPPVIARHWNVVIASVPIKSVEKSFEILYYL